MNARKIMGFWRGTLAGKSGVLKEIGVLLFAFWEKERELGGCPTSGSDGGFSCRAQLQQFNRILEKLTDTYIPIHRRETSA